MTDEKDKPKDEPKDAPKDEAKKDDPPAKDEAKKDETPQPEEKAEEKEEPVKKIEPTKKSAVEKTPDAKAAKTPDAKAAKTPDEEEPKAAGDPKGAAWAAPLVKFDVWWTKWEARLVLAVLGAEVIALSLWVLLKGLSADWKPGSSDASGLVWRGAIGAVVFGMIANRALRPKEKDEKARKIHMYGVTGAVLFGMFVARFWGGVGSEYFSNLLNWLQSASSLTLIGGLRGVATRLTMWVALLGASLATAQGKHINVDVVMRFVPVKMRVPIAVLGWMTACLVCATGAYGFVDHLAIAEFKVMEQGPCEANPTDTCTYTFGQRMTKVRHEARIDLFLLGRQASLDLKTMPKVLAGAKYKDYLHAKDWNEWLSGDDGWLEYFPKDDVEGQKLDETDATLTRLPVINYPGGNEDTNGLLRRDADFIFPFGLFMIAIRFLLRSILAITGWVKVDPDAVHGDPELQALHKDDAAPVEAKS